MDDMFDGLIKFFCSLRLTVVCLALALLLVFIGTLAQVDLGLYKAQNDFFRSFLVYWGPKGANWKLPVFPGGYLIGGVLLINLLAAHVQRFKFTRAKAGIWMVHVGLILLLLGQLLTDLLARESSLHLREGEAKNYSESQRQTELAIVDTTEPELDKVIAIPQRALMSRTVIRHAEMPFTVRVNHFYANSAVDNRQTNSAEPFAATQGIGPHATVKELPRVTDMERRDVPSAVVEIVNPQGQSIGSWLVSEFIEQPQHFTLDNRHYELSLRLRRYYKPFSLQLLTFRHDVYPGTEIPKNFSSRVLLQRPQTGEKREVLIYMNNPLRYGGETFYQADWDKDNHGTILQVVHNPSWLTPYLSCILVGLGLVVQFMSHLVGFTMKRRTA
jgi:ResB-like family